MSIEITDTEKHWYALRDLKRWNALLPAYKQLSQIGVEIFTPMHWRMFKKNGRQIRKEVPVIQNLLFAYETRQRLDPIIAETPTLQYRYKKGGKYCEPIIISDEEMNRFIYAVKLTEEPKFYSADELGQIKLGKTVRVVGGPMGGYQGKLLTVRGSKVKRILIELSSLLSVSVKIDDCTQLQVVEE